MNGISIILLLMFFSGLIAYLGDRIGMKAGKKRISIFGLRPRYSSIIITILTGIIIAGLSISILLFTYSSLRQALLNINEVMQRLENLNQQLTMKDHELTNMKEKITLKSEELSKLQEQRNELREKLKSTEEEFEQVKNSLQEARDDIISLEQNRNQLRNKIDSLEQERKSLEEKIDNLNDQIIVLTEDYQAAKEMANQYQAGMIYYMGEDIVYQKGDIIYSDVLIGGRSEDQTIKDLNDFLKRANEVAKKKNIKFDEESGMALRLQTDDILNAARVIYNMEQGQKVIVSLVSRVNVPKKDWLLANFLLNKDFIVFAKDEIIATKKINADRQTDTIERELEELLNTINKKAIEDGLLPDTRGRVGSLDFSRFYSLLNEIKDMKGSVNVKVTANEDIWREDRLSNNLKFSLEAE